MQKIIFCTPSENVYLRNNKQTTNLKSKYSIPTYGCMIGTKCIIHIPVIHEDNNNVI